MFFELLWMGLKVELTKRFYTVHKFGGSSMANAERLIEVKKILSGSKEIIVVSATKGTTSKLQALLNNAYEGQSWVKELDALEKSHQIMINDLLPEAKRKNLLAILRQDFINIQNIFATVSEIGSYSPEIQDFVLGYGEQWSAQILTAYLALSNNTLYLDASKVLFSYKKSNTVCIDWERSEQTLIEYFKDKKFDQLVVTGFIASTLDGKRTTLGRNGSDFSGAIFAKLFHALELYIWTDVDGIYTAHPAKVKSAFCIDTLSYKEALELAYFGASILHPMTIAPAEESNIPIYIKDSFKPKAPGTYISQTSTKSKHLIKGLTYIDDIALINVEGAGMAGVSGCAARIFKVMQQRNISVILISQASSEHSLCFAISNKSIAAALDALNTNLQFEIESGQINKVIADTTCAILAAVGDGMIGTPGVAGKFFDTLAKTGINIRAIAQGSSERNISAVIDSKDINKALQAVHASFYLSNRSISIGIIGPGGIGATFLDQLQSTCQQIKERYQLDIFVRAIINSKQMLLADNALTNNWREAFNQASLAPDLDSFSKHLLSDDVPHAVVIDCTANPQISQQYLSFFNQGLHIITPNKHANAGDIDYYQQIKTTATKKNCHYLYEATVCAGLPVINTLQDLIKTGDEITSIEGVVSGTLSFIFNELDKGRKFSKIVFEAKKLGYTEPDPREDLSGQDVARKLVCLARESGYLVSLSDIKVHNLVPEELRKCSLNEFLERLPQFDEQIMNLAKEAKSKHEKLCYTGKINEDGNINVAIQSIDQSHPLARLNGTDNIVIFQTKRYIKGRPMIIQGPGAGTEVTAAGIFADLFRLISYLY